jgi:hypothetical protein
MPGFDRFNADEIKNARQLCERHFAEQKQIAEDESLNEALEDEEPFTQNADTWQPIFDASNAFVDLRRRYPALATCFLWFVANAVAYRPKAQRTHDARWITYYPTEYIMPGQLAYWCDLLCYWSWAPEGGLRPSQTERLTTETQARTSTEGTASKLPVAVELMRAVIVVVSKDIDTISKDDWLCRVLNQLWGILGRDPRHDDELEEEDDDCCERLVSAVKGLASNPAATGARP